MRVGAVTHLAHEDATQHGRKAREALAVPKAGQPWQGWMRQSALTIGEGRRHGRQGGAAARATRLVLLLVRLMMFRVESISFVRDDRERDSCSPSVARRRRRAARQSMELRSVEGMRLSTHAQMRLPLTATHWCSAGRRAGLSWSHACSASWASAWRRSQLQTIGPR